MKSIHDVEALWVNTLQTNGLQLPETPDTTSFLELVTAKASEYEPDSSGLAFLVSTLEESDLNEVQIRLVVRRVSSIIGRSILSLTVRDLVALLETHPAYVNVPVAGLKSIPETMRNPQSDRIIPREVYRNDAVGRD